MRKTYQLLTFTLMLASQTVYGESYFRFRYTTKNKMSLSQILNSFTLRNVNFNNESASIVKTKTQNPEIESWNYVKENIQIDIYLEKKIADKVKISKYIKTNDRTSIYVVRKQHHQFGIFYMASNGVFQQSNQSKTLNIEFEQVSLFTLGFNYNYFLKYQPYHWASSMYFSNLKTPETSGIGKVSLNPEAGMNLYFHYDQYKKENSYFFGLDYERFNTFNLSNLESSGQTVVDLNDVSFFTIGFSTSFSAFTLPLSLKISLSKSLSYTRQSTVAEASPSLSGYKGLLYISIPISGKWSLHLLQKYHKFSGDEQVSTLRYGAGVGYVF